MLTTALELHHPSPSPTFLPALAPAFPACVEKRLQYDFSDMNPPDTTISSSSSSSETPVLESLVCSCDLPMTPTPSPTFLLLVSISCVASRPCQHFSWIAANPCQKIRTIELDGKTVKLQIVCTSYRADIGFITTVLTSALVGYRRPRAFPNHHLVLLPWCPRHLRRLRCHRHGLIQQRQAMAPGD